MWMTFVIVHLQVLFQKPRQLRLAIRLPVLTARETRSLVLVAQDPLAREGQGGQGRQVYRMYLKRFIVSVRGQRL